MNNIIPKLEFDFIPLTYVTSSRRRSNLLAGGGYWYDSR